MYHYYEPIANCKIAKHVSHESPLPLFNQSTLHSPPKKNPRVHICASLLPLQSTNRASWAAMGCRSAATSTTGQRSCSAAAGSSRTWPPGATCSSGASRASFPSRATCCCRCATRPSVRTRSGSRSPARCRSNRAPRATTRTTSAGRTATRCYGTASTGSEYRAAIRCRRSASSSHPRTTRCPASRWDGSSRTVLGRPEWTRTASAS